MDNEGRRFKRAEMAAELAHEDREYNTPSQKSIDFKKFMKLKKNENRDEIQDLEFIALKRRYKWW
jgi:hypothetical protein